MSKLKSLKLVTGGFLAGAIFFGGISYAAEAIGLDVYYGVKLIYNGVDKTPEDQEKKPFIANGTTYVPLKVISDLLQVDAKWDGDNNAVVISQITPLPEPSKVNALGGPFDSVKDDSEFMKQQIPFYLNVKHEEQMILNMKETGNNIFYIWKKDSAVGGTVSFPLNGNFSKLSFTLKLDSIRRSDVSFVDQDGKNLEVSTSKVGFDDALIIDTKGVQELVVKIEEEASTGRIDIINPILIP